MGHSVSVQPGPPALRLRFSLYAHQLCLHMSREHIPNLSFQSETVFEISSILYMKVGQDFSPSYFRTNFGYLYLSNGSS